MSFSPSSRPKRLWAFGLLSGAALIALGACSSYDPEAIESSSWYGKGFNDGCTSGIEADKSFSAKQTKDAILFDSDQAYRSGWRQGYVECRQGDPMEDSQTLGRGDEF